MTGIDDQEIGFRIHANMLTHAGKAFRKHPKGMAEWLKNSLDQYLRLRAMELEPRDGRWPLFIDLLDGKRNHGPNAVFIDFGGTTFELIEEFFDHWGDQSAATHGNSINANVTGGHGNGGKFYMREMWKKGGRLITFRDGRCTALHVYHRDPNRFGRWEKKAEVLSWRQAFNVVYDGIGGDSRATEAMGALSTEYPGLEDELDSGVRGFTALVGLDAVQNWASNDVVRGTHWDVAKLKDELVGVPQALRPIRELDIRVATPGRTRPFPLKLDSIELHPDYPQVAIDLDASEVPGLTSDRGCIGCLTVKIASLPLTGRRKQLNSVLVFDGVGNPIASYPIRELPLATVSATNDQIACELQLIISDINEIIQNERDRLVATDGVSVLLEWISDRIAEITLQIDDVREQERERDDLRVASILNSQLNSYAKQFLQELQTEIFVDFEDDPTGGGPGEGPDGEGVTGTGSRDTTDGEGSGGNEGSGGSKERTGGDQKKRSPRFPQVLLSGRDADPASTEGHSKSFGPDHPPLNQDDSDRMYNIWWINSDHPYAKKALQAGGADGLPFKNFQLSMFRDVVQREGLRYIQRREAELALDQVENELDDISNRFLAGLPIDVVRALME